MMPSGVPGNSLGRVNVDRWKVPGCGRRLARLSSVYAASSAAIKHRAAGMLENGRRAVM
jgi:hypothetical protein